MSYTCLYGVVVATAGVAVPTQSYNWMQPAIGIVQIIVGFIQAFILWNLTYRIFRSNAEQKIAEREASWFHKVVVDPQISTLETFFDSAITTMTEAVDIWVKAKPMMSAPSFDEIATGAIGDFNALMLPVRRRLVSSVAGFDTTLANALGRRFIDLQEQISTWFDTHRNPQDAGSSAAVTQILVEAHNDILTKLRHFEFVRWGLHDSPSMFKRAWLAYKKMIDEMD